MACHILLKTVPVRAEIAGSSMHECLLWLNTAWTASWAVSSPVSKGNCTTFQKLFIIFCSTSCFSFHYLCNMRTCANTSSSLPHYRFYSLRYLNPEPSRPLHIRKALPCSLSPVRTDYTGCALCKDLQYLPRLFQTQVLLNSKLLFPWTKHSTKPKART